MKWIGAAQLCGRCIVRSARMWWRHKHADEAAALAFYSLISLVPILLAAIWVASFFVDEKVATQMLLIETNRVAGSTVGTYFAQILKADVQWTGSSVSPLLGTLFLFFSATKMIAELRKSLGKVFGAPRKIGKKAALAGLVGRLSAVLMLLALGVFIVTAVIFETFMSLIMETLPKSGLWIRLATYVSPLVSFLAMTVMAAVAMRWLPARPPKFKEAIYGGGVSALMLVGLKLGLAKFLQHSDVGSFYGSALTLVLVMFWIYFAMQVFLFGAEISAELARERRQDQGTGDA